MGVSETPEEWAERTGQGELSPDELDFRSIQLGDGIGFRYIVPAEQMAHFTENYLAKMDDVAEVESIGNWWVDGNPYKGVNAVLRHRDHYVKFEIQFHTKESARLAESNHPDYKLMRSRSRPLAERQQAFDRMVTSFEAVPHPPGIETVGSPVVEPRPVLETPRVDPREQALRELTPKLQELAKSMGGRLEIEHPQYRPDLQIQLEQGRRALGSRKFRTALVIFDELIESFGDDPARWSKRGVANALMNSGHALCYLDRLPEAIERFDRVIEMGARDPEVRADMLTAESLKREALSR